MVGHGFWRWISFLLVLGWVASLPLAAQKITGDIEGNVTDSTGAVLPNVTVTAVNADTGLSRVATTSGRGAFRVPDLPIGTYKVSATTQGFKTEVQTVQILAGALSHADFKLAVGERTETVEVEGEAPLVDLSPNNNNYVDSAKIENVPLNGRDFNSLIAITPGVQRAPGGGFLAVSINGSRTTSNNYFIDGLYNNDRYYGDSSIDQTGIVGIPAVTFPPEAIEELSVQGTPSSEFGVKGGAPILLNMKSGTNRWHGSATWVNHNGFGDATNYFANHTSDCSQPGACQPTNIHNNQFNATIGGPIIKDKAFFFLYYDGQRYKSLSVSSRAVPSTADVSNALADIALNGQTVDPVGQKLLSYFPITSTGLLTASTPTTASSNSFGTKLDFKINSNNAIAFRYIFGDSLQSAPPYAGLPAGGNNPANLFNSVAPSRAQLAGISWTSNFGNNKIIESRLGYTRFSQILGPNNKIDPKSLGVDTGPLGAADFGVPYVYLYHLGYGGYIGGVQGYPLVTTPDATWDWSEHFSWVKGNHTIKIGGNFQRAYTNSIRNDARSGLTAGYFSYYSGSPYYGGYSVTGGVQDDVEQLLLGKADFASRSFGDTHRHITQNSVGFYIQDDWKIKPRLTINYGLRWDINGTVRDTNNLEANFIPGRGLVQVGQGVSGAYNADYHDFGPHAGFAWDVLGTGKLAVRGGYSRSFDVANFGALASPYSLARARTGIFTQPNLGFFNVGNTSDVANGGGNSGILAPPWLTDYTLGSGCYDPTSQTGAYICFDSSLVGPLFGPNPTPAPPFNAFSVVQNFKTPHYDNFNLSIQDELFRNNVLTLSYVGERGGNLIIYHDLNASPLGSPCTSQANCDPYRPFFAADPTLRHIIQASNDGISQYDSMQVSYNQRQWHGFDTQYNLTWSKCIDYNSVNRGGAGDYPQLNNINPVGSTAPAVANFRDSRGLCDHDVTLNFNVGGLYAAPTFHKLGERFGGGWQISAIFTGISGRPFTPLLAGSIDPTGQGLSGISIRPSYDGSPIHYNTRNPDNYVQETYTAYDQADPCGNFGVADPNNPGHFLGGLPLSPFYNPCSGAGNAGRNSVRGPGLAQLDMSLIKNTKINERLNVEFRWEVFNILNRANFYYFPNNVLTDCGAVAGNGTCAALNSGNFGTITKTSDVAAGNPVIAQGGPRNMNFSIKFTF